MNVTPPDAYSDGTLFGGVTDWYPELRLQRTRDLYELWLVQFGIPTTVPVTTPTIDPPVIYDDTLLIPTEIPTISPITSTIPPTALTTYYTSPFIHTDSSEDDTPDTPPSPTHKIPLVEEEGWAATYTPSCCETLSCSSDYITSDDSSRDSPSNSSSDAPSDSSSDTLSDSSSGHSSSDHSSPVLPSGTRSSHQLRSSISSIPHSSAAIIERLSHFSSAGPSRKRSRSPTISVPVSLPVHRALSSVRADMLPLHKRIRSSDSAIDLEDFPDESSESSIPKETSLRDDIVVRGSVEGIVARVVVKTAAQEEVDETATSLAREEAENRERWEWFEVIESIQRDQGHKIVATGQESAVQSKRISELERDNTRLRGMLDVCADWTMPNTRSGAIMTRKAVNELIGHRVAEVLEVHDVAKILKPLAEGEDEQRGGNGNGNDNVNGGGNGYDNHNVNFEGFRPVARECTYQDFLKCRLLNFKGTEGVVGLTRWFEKIEMVFHISNCPQKNQVKYATCTLLDSALTWWNTHKRTIRIEAAYAMTWTKLMKLMTEVYCPRNKIQEIETELWNFTVKGNDLTTYTKRFQELVLLCTRMVPNEEDKVERFIGGNNEKKRYVGSLPYCNKCKLHHEGPCTVRCGNCKRVGHMARDCTAVVSPNTQRVLVGNQSGVVCYECGRTGHYRKDCHKLRNQNRGNKTRNKTRNIEATTKAYAIGGGEGVNPDSNVVTGTFLLNNCYASMLFDSGADRSFVSSTFSALIDVAPSTLDTSYAVELADGIISITNVILRGCTLGLLGHPFDIDLMPVELGSFDVIIGMVSGSKSKLNIISCTKTQKYMQKGCRVYLVKVHPKKV
ncbi:putative reverse transcriptase domain-containing protein [Tanacetum coccineum]|uniref:Reverse transcriptase domain-containing protein n=1 Tax=Tanacetum coccineum TaxID=301880 RepID=A0ABQ5IGI6_9ASTR